MPLFARAHMKLLTELTREALIHGPYTEFSKEGWFLYFWKEARGEPALRSKSAPVLAFFNELYEFPAAWEGPASQITTELPEYGYKETVSNADREKLVLKYNPGKTWATVDDGIMLRMLEACLQAGFERIRVVNSGSPLGDIATDSALAFARHTLTLDSGPQYTVGWRGDSRDLGQLGMAGGFISKAQSDVKPPGQAESYADMIQARKDWHPFSKPANRTDYYYRKMQQDNCLHTVVSVTLDFITASTFPKVEDQLASLFRGHAIRPGDTIDQLSADQRKQLCQVTTAKGKQSLYADRQQLYLVVLCGSFFDTQKRQTGNAFPEVAVKQIPVKHILGSVSFVRVFDGLHESEGFTAYYDAAKSSSPTFDACLAFAGDKLIAQSLWPKLQEEFTKISASMPFHARWTGSGGEKVGMPLKVGEVIDATGRKLM